VDQLLLVGLNHKTAPVELRERCRVGDPAAALEVLRGFAGEAVILSTCNRFEVYAHRVEDPDRIVAWIAERAGVGPSEISEHCYLRQGRNASKHLFFVAASLDSLVVGETQIRGQVKDAYGAAQEAGAVGPSLHRLFQSALRVSKEISETTGVGRGNVSVAGAAADLAERVFGELEEASVLVVGAGETAELVMNHLQSRGVSRFHVANRTLHRAEELAARFEAGAGDLEDLVPRLAESDVLVAAAGGEEPLIAKKAVQAALRKRRGKPIVAIDIAVPRGVDAGIDSLDNVYRFDMEALREITTDALRHRRRDFLHCCTLIDGATLRLAEATRAQQAGNVISELEAHYRSVAEAELEDLERRLPELGEPERDQIRRSIRRIVRKLMHRPVRALRQVAPDEGEVLRRAFGVEADDADD
jgi:glutamyl-tRNA reductase